MGWIYVTFRNKFLTDLWIFNMVSTWVLVHPGQNQWGWGGGEQQYCNLYCKHEQIMAKITLLTEM
jgi:hypothetical protein